MIAVGLIAAPTMLVTAPPAAHPACGIRGQATCTGPVVLAGHNGHWLLAHNTAMAALKAIWANVYEVRWEQWLQPHAAGAQPDKPERHHARAHPRPG